MAQDSDFHIGGRMEWKTDLPSRTPHCPRTSPGFSLHGHEWRLEFACRSVLGTDCYRVSLVPGGDPVGGSALRRPFEVVTYVRDPSDASKCPRHPKWRRVEERVRSSVWEVGLHHPGGILLKLDWLRNKPREVRIVCLFYGAEPSVSKTEPGNQLRTGTVERGVQVTSEVPRDVESLSEDLSRLLEKEVLPDVTLECGGRTLRAHRSVLGARSGVFRAMFQNETLESQTGTVKVQDVDVSVLEKLLQYVYSGDPGDISEGCAADLYEAADKYDVHSLKGACAYWIERHLAEANCVRYLRVADAHSDVDLRAAVVTFLTQNPTVLKSEAWLSLSRELPVLANEVFQTYVASTVQ